MIVTKITNRVVCPECQSEAGVVDHLKLKEYPIRWYCDSCGHEYILTNVSDDIKTIHVSKGEYQRHPIAVYITHGDMCIIIKHTSGKVKLGTDIDWEMVEDITYRPNQCAKSILVDKSWNDLPQLEKEKFRSGLVCLDDVNYKCFYSYCLDDNDMIHLYTEKDNYTKLIFTHYKSLVV